MEIRVNDMVEVEYEGTRLIGQVSAVHYALGQYDVQLPAFGSKRFPRNCIRRVVGREEETLSEETSKQEDSFDSFKILGTETGSFDSYDPGLAADISELPGGDEPADTFGGGGGFSGGGGGDSWGNESSTDSSGSSDSGSSSSE